MRRLEQTCLQVALQSLENRAGILKLCSQQGSGPSVASGLKAWHTFAITFLNYMPAETLPPKSAQDVLKYIALFASAGTAKNYVGHITWACKFHALDLRWRTDEITLALQGLKKAELSAGSRNCSRVPLLTSSHMLQLITLCDTLPGFDSDGDLFLLSWQFLLRVASEAVPVQCGEESELGGLPVGRHSCLWIDSDFTCHLKLRRRKHMPEGSYMARKCLCKVGRVDSLCLSHRLHRRLANMPAGQPLFSLTAPQFLKRFRNLLELLHVPGGASYGFKAFRAGKATDLAKSGCPVHLIMQMGQWRSAAILRYVSPDALDEGVFWAEVHEEEDE